ncbi:MAG: hypothetical protein L7T84_14245 [Akkermansiaceae bacterium]|nr:hypothetical protein [Akkermansiaceae bacterium]
MPPQVGSVSAPKKSDSVIRNVARTRNPVSVQKAMTEVPAHEAPFVLKTEAPVMVKVEEEPDAASGEMPEDRDEMIMADGSRRIRRRKKKLKKEKSKALLIFTIVWMAIIASVSYLLKSGDDSKQDQDEESADQESIIAARNRLFAGAHFPKINDSFKAFLGQFESGRRLQFIDQSSRLSLQFNRFYRSAVFPTPEGEIGAGVRNVIEIKSGPDPVLGLETIWVDEKKRILETVHVHDGEAWKLDWEAFGPYSSSSWVLFVSGTERSEGTFRLYMRKMKSLDDSKRFFVKFYAPPVFGESDRKASSFDVESPEVEVDARSALGQQFIEVLENHQNKDFFLGSVFPYYDPKGYLRVTVKLAWELNEKDEPVLVLKELISPSWYGQRIVDTLDDFDPGTEVELNEESEVDEETGLDKVKPILKDE